MTSAANLRSILRDSKAGGFLGRGIRLFDLEYYSPSLDEMKQIVSEAMDNLRSEGITIEDYAENGGDCDNFATLIYAEVLKIWMKRNEGKESYPAITFGTGVIPGHAVNVSVCDGKVQVWNYGELTDWSASDLKEVEFR